MSIYNALDTACDQAQRYADELHVERTLRIAAEARLEAVNKQLRDVEILLSGKMPMTALDYIKQHRAPQAPYPVLALH